MSANNTIQQSVSIHASADQVFRALTEARTLERWFPSQAQADLRPGGKYRFVFENQDPQQGGQQEGEFLAVRPNAQISYTWDAGGVATQVNFTLDEASGTTRVSLSHTGFGEGEAGNQVREMHATVWKIYMENLKSYIEIGQDQRKALLGQIVT